MTKEEWEARNVRERQESLEADRASSVALWSDGGAASPGVVVSGEVVAEEARRRAEWMKVFGRKAAVKNERAAANPRPRSRWMRFVAWAQRLVFWRRA